MVKDLRKGEETGNIESVMDGNLDNFIDSYLKWKATETNKQ
jgi:peptide chain release factor 2